jgi:hypothetical protein
VHLCEEQLKALRQRLENVETELSDAEREVQDVEDNAQVVWGGEVIGHVSNMFSSFVGFPDVGGDNSSSSIIDSKISTLPV